MKNIYLMRHSKAGQTKKQLLNDHDRPLTEKGRELCPAIGKYIRVLGKPDLILCSTAKRAKDTAELISKPLGKSTKLIEMQKLYLASPGEILSVINEINDKINSVLIVGHNNGLQKFCVEFAGKGDKKKFREMRHNFPPASLAVFGLAQKKWDEVKMRSGFLKDFVMAKDLAVTS